MPLLERHWQARQAAEEARKNVATAGADKYAEFFSFSDDGSSGRSSVEVARGYEDAVAAAAKHLRDTGQKVGVKTVADELNLSVAVLQSPRFGYLKRIIKHVAVHGSWERLGQISRVP